MNAHPIIIVTAAAIAMVGCSKRRSSSSTASSRPIEQRSAESATVPVTQPAMTAWEQGDKSTAVSRFLAADWSARPLFPASSVLSLNENQFKALSKTQQQAKLTEMYTQLGALKELVDAVMQAGDTAAAQGDTSQARKCFTSLQQCGAALESPNCVKLVQVVGQAFEKLAQFKLARLEQ